jgi:HEPN domain-containing protein
MKKLTAEWVRKAEADLRAARLALTVRPLLTDNAAFACQQALEKYLKALLQEAGLAFPKTHDLEKLHKLLPPAAGSLTVHQRAFKVLSAYAVDYRYPGRHASARQARSALRLAEVIRRDIRKLLGLRTRKPPGG